MYQKSTLVRERTILDTIGDVMLVLIGKGGPLILETGQTIPFRRVLAGIGAFEECPYLTNGPLLFGGDFGHFSFPFVVVKHCGPQCGGESDGIGMATATTHLDKRSHFSALIVNG